MSRVLDDGDVKVDSCASPTLESNVTAFASLSQLKYRTVSTVPYCIDMTSEKMRMVTPIAPPAGDLRKFLEIFSSEARRFCICPRPLW